MKTTQQEIDMFYQLLDEDPCVGCMAGQCGDCCTHCSVNIEGMQYCPHCGKLTATRVDITDDNIEAAYNNLVSHGLCEHCNKPFS